MTGNASSAPGLPRSARRSALRETSTGARRTDTRRELVAFAAGEIRTVGTIGTALEAELSFYGQVFGFDTPGAPEREPAR